MRKSLKQTARTTQRRSKGNVASPQPDLRQLYIRRRQTSDQAKVERQQLDNDY